MVLPFSTLSYSLVPDLDWQCLALTGSGQEQSKQLDFEVRFGLESNSSSFLNALSQWALSIHRIISLQREALCMLQDHYRSLRLVNYFTFSLGPVSPQNVNSEDQPKWNLATPEKGKRAITKGHLWGHKGASPVFLLLCPSLAEEGK